ncbi:hypothetical protein Plec18167_006703 [Paecilomyces lecythidis]|uniref:Ankyrin n=1 Tax=Paecilomyces lecythidis TaxID=3004212 RepID=A0ABR3X9S3_9EURO
MRRHGADMNARSNVDIAGGHTALMQKVSEGDEKAVLRLLQNGADANAASPSNLTPLILASSEGYTHIVNILLQYGAHIDARDHQAYFAALNAAADNNNLAIVKLLVEKRAYIDPASVDGMTPLLLAVSRRNVEIAHFLIEHGANINYYNDDGYTPLMLAIERNEISIVSELLRRGCDVNAKDKLGMTAFDWARNTGKEDCLALLQSAHFQGRSREDS